MSGRGSNLSVRNRTNGKWRFFRRKASRKVSAETRQKVTAFLEADYDQGLYTSVSGLRNLLSTIPESENILLVYYDNGFNLLQKCVAENNIEAVELILSRNPDVNDSPCSLPLHIACLKGYTTCAQYLIEHGARQDTEARMCWPGPHAKKCPGTKKESKAFHKEITRFERSLVKKEGRDKCQNALFYTLYQGQSAVLDYLLSVHTEESKIISKLGSLLAVASEKQAWACCNVLIKHKAEKIDSEVARNYLRLRPIHPQMTLFHFLFNTVSKPAEFTLKICKALLSNGLISDVNTQDPLGNTPIHSLIIRYSFEETRRVWLRDYRPWCQVKVQKMVRMLLRGVASESLNQPGNSTLSLIIRYINDWKFIYDLLNGMLEIGANPVIKDREGRCPLMACIIKLLNDDLYKKLDTASKWYYIHCLRLLCMAGANPNIEVYQSMSPLHVLIYTVLENFSSETDNQMVENFDFIRSILNLLFEYGLDPNGGTIKGSPNVLLGILKLVEKSRWPIDLEKVYELVVTLIQYGVDTNKKLRFPRVETNFVNGNNPFLIAECSYFLAHMFAMLAEKQELLQEAEECAIELLSLIYSSMDHDELSECLDLLHAQLPATEPGSPLRILCDTVRDLRSRPRTLRESTRITVNRCLDRRPALHAHRLPLPKYVKYYLQYDV